MASKSSHVQWNLKGFIKLGAVIAFLVVLTIIIFKIAIVPKTPATIDQVWDVMVEQGYEPQDITQQYYEKDSDFKKILERCVAIEKDDVHFEFFVFNNKNSAIDVYGQFYTQIILNYNAIHKIETNKKIANYCIYTLNASGSYSVAIYVENTAIYAYCDSENAAKIGKILQEIDYFDK